MEVSLEAGGSHPMGFEDASLAGAGVLHPAQGGGTFLAVVVGKHDIPQRQNGDGRDNVN
jgi:hypothetical protein